MLLNGCISDLTLDAWRAGELDRDRAQELDDHVRQCSRCLARQGALQGEAEAFERRPDRDEPLRRVRMKLKQRARRREWASIAGAGLAAVSLLMFGLGRPAPELEPDGRPKGASSVGFYVRRGDALFRWQPGQPVRPGDRLRFTWRSARPVYVAILSHDARGVATVYFPAPDRVQQRMPAGEEVDLPLAVELDETLGPEQVYALGCESPLVVEALRRSLETDARLIPPSGCELAQLSLTKEARR